MSVDGSVGKQTRVWLCSKPLREILWFLQTIGGIQYESSIFSLQTGLTMIAQKLSSLQTVGLWYLMA